MSRLHLVVGSLIWTLFAVAWRPHPYEPRWIVVLLLFSPLVLMPLSVPLLWPAKLRFWQMFEMPAAALLAPAFTFRPGWLAALLALPWLILRGVAAFEAMKEWGLTRSTDPGRICLCSARAFPAIGAAWLVAERMGWYPLAFDPLTVLLTAAHFHHAGFTLPLMAGMQGRERPGPGPRLAGICILAGVPLVALGITATHTHIWAWVEPFAVTLLVVGALIVASLQVLRLGDRSLSQRLRLSFGLSGLCLGLAMIFALRYGLRSVWPMMAPPMPSMWAVHGSLNVFGFGLLGILSWRALVARKPEN